MIELVSWQVVLPIMVVLVMVQVVGGVVFVRFVYPWARGRKITEWMGLTFFATTPLVVFAALGALLGRQDGDYLLALGCLLMWIGQLPFMFGGLPVLEWLLADERRQAEKVEALARVRDDGQA